MKRLMFLLLIIITALAGSSEAIISQQFDSSGRLVPAGRRPIAHYAERARKHSLPEGVELRKDIRYEFYPVFGKTFADIVRSTEENGPVDTVTKKHRPSGYDWRFGWTFKFSFITEEDEDPKIIHCDIVIEDIAIKYDITVTLPALTDDSALNPIEKEMWKNHLTKLIEQEHNHVRIIKDETREILVRRLGEIDYLKLTDTETISAEKAAERFIRAESEKLAKETATQIRQKLGSFDAEHQKKDNFPSRRR